MPIPVKLSEIVDEMTPENVRREGLSIINKYLG